MKFNEWVTYRLENGPVDMDGAYGNQCIDLLIEYCQKVLGLTNGVIGADCAKNLIYNDYLMQNVERIDNYLEFVPQKGDIAVWLGGQYGHVAICLGEANIDAFLTLDQNWKPQALTQEWHNYLYMAPLVFLRPKDQSNIKDEFQQYNVVVTTEVLNVRKGPGTEYDLKYFGELTPNAQEQVLNHCGYRANGLVEGCEATIFEQVGNWGRIPSGWICLDYTERV